MSNYFICFLKKFYPSCLFQQIHTHTYVKLVTDALIFMGNKCKTITIFTKNCCLDGNRYIPLNCAVGFEHITFSLTIPIERKRGSVRQDLDWNFEATCQVSGTRQWGKTATELDLRVEIRIALANVHTHIICMLQLLLWELNLMCS